jgi:hypothetical protein
MIEQVITMVLRDGTSSGIVECALDNWDGLCYKIPRTRLKEASSLHGIKNNGIYILFGEDGLTGNDIAYIGKSTNVLSRLDEHKRKKDFWSEALIFVTENNNINPAHIAFLEYDLCKLAKEINKETNRYIVVNDQQPKDPNLSTAEKIKAKRFEEKVIVMISALKYRVFDKFYETKEITIDNENILYLKLGGEIYGKGIVTDEGFLVLKGTKIKSEYSDKIPSSLMKRFIAERSSKDIENNIYTNDHLFKSPSMAGLVITGRSCSGRAEWKNKDGKSLKKIEELTK